MLRKYCFNLSGLCILMLAMAGGMAIGKDASENSPDPTSVAKSYFSSLKNDDRKAAMKCFVIADKERETPIAAAFVELALGYRHLGHVVESRFHVGDSDLSYLIRPFSDMELSKLLEALPSATTQVNGDNATISLQTAGGPVLLNLVRIENTWGFSPYAMLHLPSDSPATDVDKAIALQRRYTSAANEIATEIESDKIGDVKEASVHFERATMNILVSDIPTTQASAHSSSKNVLVMPEYGRNDPISVSIGIDSVVSVFGDGRVGIWSLKSGKILEGFKLNHKPKSVGGIALGEGVTLKIATLYLEQPDPDSCFISLWDDRANMLWEKNSFRMQIAAILGFTEDQKHLLCQTRDNKMLAIDVTTGNQAWTISFTDVVGRLGGQLNSMQASRDGKICCVISDESAVCRDQSNRELWKKDAGASANCLALKCVTENVRILDTKRSVVKYVDFANGNEIDELKVDGAQVFSMSPGIEAVVGKRDNELLLFSFHAAILLPLERISEQWEVRFGEDGKHLLLIPGFPVITTTSDNSSATVKVHRDSNIAKVLDVVTGNIVQSFPLEIEDARAVTRP